MNIKTMLGLLADVSAGFRLTMPSHPDKVNAAAP
jgi:hypothetical protein